MELYQKRICVEFHGNHFAILGVMLIVHRIPFISFPVAPGSFRGFVWFCARRDVPFFILLARILAILDISVRFKSICGNKHGMEALSI
jgi:hypothetical protein